MPVYRLADPEAKYLANKLPETAMGFQLIDSNILSLDGDTFLVIAARIAIPFMSYANLVRDIRRIGQEPWDSVIERAIPAEFPDEPHITARMLDIKLAASLLDRSVDWTPQAESVFHRQEVIAYQKLTEPRLFFRFGASPVDPRVLPDGSWAPGTYATTYNDLRLIPSGFAAVGRYALPNPHSARYVFPILTMSSPVYIGTVTPNFGQAGGGVEVLFPDGAKPIHGRPHRIERE
jgi:hypothetical protein